MVNTNRNYLSIIFGLLFILFLIILAYLSKDAAVPMKTDWHININSKMRIVMSEFKDNTLYIGFEISLDDETYTYWSNPGDSGIEPNISISAKNVKNHKVLWPLPEMIKDDFGTNYGYYGNNIIPIKISLGNTNDPFDLDLYYNLGVCNNICTPIDGKIKITILDSYRYYRKKSNTRIQKALEMTPTYRPDGMEFISAINLIQLDNNEIINLEFSEPIRKIYPMTSDKFYLSDIENIKDSYKSYNFSYSPKKRNEKISKNNFSVIILNDKEFFIEDFTID